MSAHRVGWSACGLDQEQTGVVAARLQVAGGRATPATQRTPAIVTFAMFRGPKDGAHGHAQIAIVALKRAAAQRPVLTRYRSLGIDGVLGGINAVPVGGPLPDVAEHVVEGPEGVR